MLACMHSFHKQEIDQVLVCRILEHNFDTRPHYVLSGNKVRDAPRCWTTATSITNKIKQELHLSNSQNVAFHIRLQKIHKIRKFY